MFEALFYYLSLNERKSFNDKEKISSVWQLELNIIKCNNQAIYAVVVWGEVAKVYTWIFGDLGIYATLSNTCWIKKKSYSEYWILFNFIV